MGRGADGADRHRGHRRGARAARPGQSAARLRTTPTTSSRALTLVGSRWTTAQVRRHIATATTPSQVVKAIVGSRMLLELDRNDVSAVRNECKRSQVPDASDHKPSFPYWVSYRSHLIFQVGWASRFGYSLHSTPDYKESTSSLSSESETSDSNDTTQNMFKYIPLNRIQLFDDLLRWVL